MEELCKDHKLSIVCCSDKAGGGEKYEKGTAAHGDRMFEKFLKKVREYPQQILR